jgi:23S rRNA pseudouridine1911/1915/1917 synthase
MTRQYTITVPAGKKPERLDIFLAHHVENATRSKVQNAIREGAVLVNGKRARSSHTVAPGEVIVVALPRPAPVDAVAEDIPLEIVHEDDDVLVVNKPAGMVTHPAYGNYTGTLVNALLFHCASLSTMHGPVRPGIVHRLDKDTSGLLVVAKSDQAHAFLARQFAQRTIDREYWAIVWGRFALSRGTVEAELGRSRSDRKKMAVVAGGKPASTEYAVMEEFDYLSLVRLHLLTGRTHQIRVHLAHIHHPVLGDPTYSGRRIMYGPGTSRQRAEVHDILTLLPRQALHAKTIGFVHPRTHVTLRFESSLPADMEAILSILRGKRGM